jgi:hypothetical protein
LPIFGGCHLCSDRLRAPREDRAALVEPPFEDVPELVAENLRHQSRLHDCNLQGRSLAEISLLARTELLAAARRWTGAYRNVKEDVKGNSPIFADAQTGTLPAKIGTVPDPNGLIYLAGHQPQMFHPGVWFKNFALGELARRDGATAVNLIIDGDTRCEAAVRVPGGSVAQPHAALIPFDRSDTVIPYEERKIEDRELFASFARRAIEQMTPLVPDPLLQQYWPLVQSRAQHCDNLGACLVQARHQLEGNWGLETLEVPHSCVCKGEAFQWFVAHLLARGAEFRTVYNQSLQDYRRLRHIRSRSHPAPDLAEEGPWIEAPLWIWTAESPRRRRLFARAVGGEVLLSDRQAWEARLPLRPDGDASRAVERLLEVQHSGVRIRPRALITTLWARLALGDLFIHGIGGAKYDRVTDRLIEQFFGLAAPRFLVVSATLHLPIQRDPVTADDVRAVQNELRAVTYHPERFLTHVPHLIEDMIAEKRRWIATPQTAQNARQRCQAIRRINAALQPSLDERREQLAARLADASRRLQAEHVLAWREYAFCLYPESTLQKFLSGLLHRTV